MNRKLGIFGASGLARELADIAIETGYNQIFFIDIKDGIEPITKFNIIPENNLLSYKHYTSADYIIGIGNGFIRKTIYKKFPQLNFINLIHPTVRFNASLKQQLVTLKGNIFFEGARFTTNIQLGNFGLFNLNITIAHDCLIEDFVTVSPGANISGNVFLKEESYIGAGATILQGKSLKEKIIIGNKSIIGAGSVVVKNVNNNQIVKGVPAK